LHAKQVVLRPGYLTSSETAVVDGLVVAVGDGLVAAMVEEDMLGVRAGRIRLRFINLLESDGVHLRF
jgi:hypothetical protein